MVYVLLCQQPLRQCVFQRLEGSATLYVQSSLHCHGTCLGWCFHYFMLSPHIPHGSAIRNDMSLESPLLAQYVCQQPFAGRCRLAIDAVVGSHDDFHLGLLHQRAERRQVCLPKVALRGFNVCRMARHLRTAMCCKVFAAGSHFQVYGVVALHTPYEGTAHRSREEGVFTPCLHTPSPARIAQDIDIRAPEGQSCIAGIVAVFTCNAIFGTCLRSYGIAYLLYQFRMECRRQSYGLWKYRSPAVAPHAVQAFVPPVIGFYAQSLDAWSLVHHL